MSVRGARLVYEIYVPWQCSPPHRDTPFRIIQIFKTHVGGSWCNHLKLITATPERFVNLFGVFHLKAGYFFSQVPIIGSPPLPMGIFERQSMEKIVADALINIGSTNKSS